MNTLKHKNMMAAYEGHRGPVTVAAVEAGLTDELRQRLTGHELGLVCNAINAAYHRGRASHRGIDVCDDCVWLPWGGGKYDADNALPGSIVPPSGDNGQLVPIEALRSIKIDKTKDDKYTYARYTMDYTEKM